MRKNVNQLKIGSLLSYGQMFLNILIGLVYTPVMIRLLGQSDYGLYNTVSSIISMLSILSLGFNSSYIRYYAKYNKEENEEAIEKLNGIFLIVFSVIGIIALFCGLFLSFNLKLVFDSGFTKKEYTTAKVLMLLLTVNLALSFPFSVFSNIISAHEKFVFLKLLGMGKTVFSPLITLPILLMGYGSIALVVVNVSVSIVVDVVYILYVKIALKQKFTFRNFEKGLFKSLFVYSIFIAINLIVDQLNWNIDKLLLGRFCGTNSVAVYSIGFTIYQYYMMFSTAISGVLAPKIHGVVNDIHNSEEKKNLILTNLFIKVGRIQMIILGLIMTGFIFFGRYFISFWAGKEYNTAYFIVLLLMIPSTASLIQSTGIEIRRAKNKHKMPAVFMLLTAISNAIISGILIQFYGVIGTAIGTAIALVVNIIIVDIYYQRQCKINICNFWLNILGFFPALIVPILLGVILNCFWGIYSFWIFFIQILIYSIVYLLSVYFLGISREEKESLLMLLKKIKGQKEKK